MGVWAFRVGAGIMSLWVSLIFPGLALYRGAVMCLGNDF